MVSWVCLSFLLWRQHPLQAASTYRLLWCPFYYLRGSWNFRLCWLNVLMGTLISISSFSPHHAGSDLRTTCFRSSALSLCSTTLVVDSSLPPEQLSPSLRGSHSSLFSCRSAPTGMFSEIVLQSWAVCRWQRSKRGGVGGPFTELTEGPPHLYWERDPVGMWTPSWLGKRPRWTLLALQVSQLPAWQALVGGENSPRSVFLTPYGNDSTIDR